MVGSGFASTIASFRKSNFGRFFRVQISMDISKLIALSTDRAIFKSLYPLIERLKIGLSADRAIKKMNVRNDLTSFVTFKKRSVNFRSIDG